MRRKSFGNMQCPIARSLDRVGEWWSILILRDSFHGLKRFDEFQDNLGIAPNMLARRLKSLVEAGLLERRRYSERPPRDEYVLTQAGRDFRPVLWALLAWGNRHFAPEGPSVVIADSRTGEQADPVLVDRKSGRLLAEPDFRSAIAFYPDCATSYAGDPDVVDRPIRIFHGTPDDYNPVSTCKAYVARLEAEKRDVTLTEYPESQHGFDLGFRLED